MPIFIQSGRFTPPQGQLLPELFADSDTFHAHVIENLLLPNGEFVGPTVTSAANLSTYTIGVNFGTATADRLILVVIGNRTDGGANAVQPTTVTIGGVSATKDVGNNSGLNAISIWKANVPSGTSGNVVVTYSATQANCSVTPYRLVDYSSSTPVATSNNSWAAATSVSLNLNASAGGVVIGGLTNHAAGASWTGVTEQDDASLSDTAAGVLAFIGTNNSTTNTTLSYTFTNQAIGSADATRHVVVAVYNTYAVSGADPSSVTIGGVNATKMHSRNFSTSHASFWRLAVAAGTTATIVVNIAGGASCTNCGIAVYTLTGGMDPATAFATGGADINTQASVTLNVNAPQDGVGIAIFRRTGTSNNTWAGATENLDFAAGTEAGYSCASFSAAALASPRSVSASWSGNDSGVGISITWKAAVTTRLHTSGLAENVIAATPRTVSATFTSSSGCGAAVSYR